MKMYPCCDQIHLRPIKREYTIWMAQKSEQTVIFGANYYPPPWEPTGQWLGLRRGGKTVPGVSWILVRPTALAAIHPQLPCEGWRFVPYDDCGWTDLITTIVTVIRDYKRSFSLHYQYTQLKWTTIHFHSRHSRVLANRERVRESSGEVPELLALSSLLDLGKCLCNKVSVRGFLFDI